MVLLLCFGTGQAIVLTHSHVAVLKTVKTKQNPSSSNPDDNCKICQLSHSFIAMLYNNAPTVDIYATLYKHLQVSALSYPSISQLLAATRGPPVV